MTISSILTDLFIKEHSQWQDIAIKSGCFAKPLWHSLYPTFLTRRCIFRGNLPPRVHHLYKVFWKWGIMNTSLVSGSFGMEEFGNEEFWNWVLNIENPVTGISQIVFFFLGGCLPQDWRKCLIHEAWGKGGEKLNVPEPDDPHGLGLAVVRDTCKYRGSCVGIQRPASSTLGSWCQEQTSSWRHRLQNDVF